MDASEAIDLAREAVFVTLKLGLPMMLLALVVGLAISMIQALTQLQEPTLSFVPKVVIILLSLLVVLPFMLQTLESFTQGLVSRIIHG